MHPEDIKTEKRLKHFATLTKRQVARRGLAYASFCNSCHDYGRRMNAQSRLIELIPDEVERWRICNKFAKYDGLRIF